MIDVSEIPEVETVESVTRRAKADMAKMNAQLDRSEVWNAPPDAAEKLT